MKLLIVSIGRDIVSGAERQLGMRADAVVSADEIRPEEFPRIRKEVYGHFKAWQGESVRLVLSGPLALSFTLGQLVGLNHFDVTVMHYDSAAGRYVEAPVPERKEIL